MVTQPAFKAYPYDVRKMTAVTEVSEGPFILVGRKALGFNNVTDLINFGKANPGKLTFGSGGGVGSSLSLNAELLRISAGIAIVNVPYQGAAAVLNDLLGGRVDVMFDAMPVQVEQVKAGNVSGLAVTGAARAAALPDVPTMAESGYKDFVVSNYFGLLAPPNTPAAIVQKLRDEVAKAVAAPDIVDLFAKQGMQPVADEPKHFADLIAADLARWTDGDPQSRHSIAVKKNRPLRAKRSNPVPRRRLDCFVAEPVIGPRASRGPVWLLAMTMRRAYGRVVSASLLISSPTLAAPSAGKNAAT